MGKVSIDSFDIHKGHTLEEYRKFFAVPYDKGKLLSFKEDELELMSHKRIYWEIINEKGEKEYYAIPSRFKPFKPHNRNLPLYRNKKPFIIAIGIFSLCFVSCISSYYIGKNINKKPAPQPQPEPVVPTELIDRFKDHYFDKHKDPLDGTFSCADLAQVAIALLQEKGDYFTVGRGTNDTTAIVMPVHVNVTNSFIKKGNNSIEESISHTTNWLAPSFGKRDFYTEGGTVKAYSGSPFEKEKVNWNEQMDHEYTKEEYDAASGKNPMSPFLYIITNDTVLTDKVTDFYPEGTVHKGESKATKEGDGYLISMDLHNEKSIERYALRMKYLSGKDSNGFKTIHLDFHVDKNFILTKSIVKESYYVTAASFPSDGMMETHYYTDNVPDIPKITENFDYSKYPF